MKRRILSLVLGLVSTTGFADTFKFCFEPWEPYGVRSEKGEVSGSAVEFYQELFAKLGHKIEFEQMPSARCYEAVKTGAMDGLIFNSPGNVEGTVDLKFVTDYWMVAAIVPASSKESKYSGISQFKGKSVGVVKQYPYPEEFKNFEGMNKDETVDAINNLRKVSNSRIDVMFEDPMWADLMAKKEGLNVKSLKPLAASTANCGSLAKKHAALAPKLDAAAKDLIKAGLLEKLYQKHLKMGFKEFKSKYGIKN